MEALARVPNAPVTDLFISSDGATLRVATPGRGIWELDAPGAWGS